MFPLISICIPAYGEPDLLKRCLQSVAEQDYSNIEVIICDDTPDNRVKIICYDFKQSLRLTYFQNTPALGSPANWNSALDKATGDLVILLHHDDWLISKDSITRFSEILIQNDSIDAVFGLTEAIDEKGRRRVQKINLIELNKRPESLLLANKIGPPSNLMFRNKIPVRYDVAYKWLVDIHFYTRIILGHYRLSFINKKLIEVGIHTNQTTEVFKSNPLLVVRENILFAKEFYLEFSGWKMYDYYWRLFRNAEIDKQKLSSIGIDPAKMPRFLHDIIYIQENLPYKLLKIGFISKVFMLASYFKNGFK